MAKNCKHSDVFILLMVGLFLVLFNLTGCWRDHDSHHSQSDEDGLQGETIDGLADLIAYIQGLDDQLSSDQQSDLLAKLDDADDEYADGDPCDAAGYIGEYLDACQDLRVDDLAGLAEDLFNRGWMIRSDLLSGLSEPCSGYEGVGAIPEVLVSESDNTHVTGSVTFGEPRMWTVTGDGETFTQLQVPGVAFPMSPEGYPAVPVYRRFVAVPQEAEVSVSATANGAKTIRMNLYPVQTQPMDADDEEMPFVQDEDAYATDANYPENICDVQIIDKIRDVYIAMVTCAAGQYNPVTDTMTLYDSVDFVVSFTGGSGAFITERSTSPFDRTLSLVDGIVINSDKLVDYVEPVAEATLGGEELLILTHPDFLEAAERLAEWKNEKGIITKIYTVCDGDGPGPDENSEIDAWIKNHYYSNIIHPSYILIIGDAEFVPTFDLFSFCNDIGTDYPYSVLEEFEATCSSSSPPYPLPDMALGRLPVDTLDEANIVVDKIITYESAPPAQDSFYQNASVVGAFQCCSYMTNNSGVAQRTFIECAEFCRDAMQNNGITVERIYTKTCGEGIEECVPRYYNDGTPLPEDLLPESGFVWDGDTQDIINAFTSDQGRFLIIHRDHGSEFGWEHPFFGNDDASNLDGQIAGMLPVVFSINCFTGIFDNETGYFDEDSGYEIHEDETYLCERLLRNPNGGAIACIGASRPSPSWPNTYLAMGMIDAIWPQTIADFGGQEAIIRLGDILNYGKLYMLDIDGVYYSTENELLLHHCIGDPTLEIWTQPPEELPEDAILQDTVDGVRVDYGVDGTVVTLYQEMPDGVVALGRGTIENGQAEISYIQDPDETYPITVSVSKPGYVAGVLTPTAKTITASAGTGGSISPSGSVSVDYGADQSFSITPATGYAIADVLVDGESVGAESTYTFENVTADHTISVSFSQITFNITASSGENGSIDPGGSTTVNYGSDQLYTFTPDTGYEVDTVKVDGQSTTVTGNTYTFMNVTDNHTIEVTFQVVVEETAWSKTYGLADWYCEYHTYGLDVTDDGGYVFAAEGDIDGWNDNFWVVRLDSQGNVTWEQGFTGTSLDHPQVVRQTSDGGFIVAGESYSFRTGSSYCDIWVIKLTSSGTISWQYSYGGTGYDTPHDLQETFDEQGNSTGYLLAGYTTSFGAGGRDVWLVKLGNSGSILHEIALGGAGDERGKSVAPTPDGGCIVVAYTQSFGAGGRDIWAVKLDSVYSVEWEKAFGGTGDEYSCSVVCTDDGGYVVGAYTASFGAGENDFWALKLDADGNLVWQYTYGGTGTDTAQDLAKTDDGGYIMTGWTLSFDVESYDAWVVKLDSTGLIQWQKAYDIIYDYGTYTYNGSEWTYGVVQAADGGYVMAGDSWPGDDRDSDVWVFKVDSTGALGCDMDTDTSAVENSTVSVTTVIDTSELSSMETTDAVVNATTCSSYNAAPNVFTQCEIPENP